MFPKFASNLLHNFFSHAKINPNLKRDKMKINPLLYPIFMTILFLPPPSLVNAQVGPGNYGNVSSATICTRDGDNYILRYRPGQRYRSRTKLSPGRKVILTGDSKNIDGFTWRKVNFLGSKGWIRGDYLCN